MGRDRPWKTTFPEHLRRSRSRKPKWQKKLTQKSKELTQNLEKLENRIFAKRRQQKMREVRMAARQEMEAASFPQFDEESKTMKAALEAKRRAPVIPRLEDPDEDIFVPSEDSQDESDVEEAARKRQERVTAKKLKRKHLQDPLGLDEEEEGEGEGEGETVAQQPSRRPSSQPGAKPTASSTPKSNKSATVQKPPTIPAPTPADKKASTAADKPAAAKPQLRPKQPKAVPPSEPAAPAGLAAPRRSVGPGTALLKKRQRDFDSVVSREVDEAAERPRKRLLTAFERRQLKKARKQASP